MSTKLEAPLFRGATKPVMFFGIPINALLLVTAPPLLIFFLFYVVLGYASVILLVPVLAGIPIMRQITKKDDQFLNMWTLEIQERLTWKRRNRTGNLTVIPPCALRHQRFIKAEDIHG